MPDLSLVETMKIPLLAQQVKCCSLNEDHLAIGIYDYVRVFTIGDAGLEHVSTIHACSKFCSMQSLSPLQPTGNRLWVNSKEDIVLFRDGVQETKMSVGENVLCIRLSTDVRVIFVGTEASEDTADSNLFSCDISSGQVTKTPLHWDGESICQIEEAHGGRALIVRSQDSHTLNSYSLILVSVEDWCVKRLLTRKSFISYMSIISNVVIFGENTGIQFIYAAPRPTEGRSEAQHGHPNLPKGVRGMRVGVWKFVVIRR